MANGKYVLLDMSSVKSDVEKSVTYLVKKLPQVSLRSYAVVFLGEQHNNPVDMGVTARILADPPISVPTRTRVVFERQLDQVPVYVPGPKITDSRTEAMDMGLSRKERSHKIALMIKDAFEEHDRNMVFVVCGSAHAEEIYSVLDKKFTQPFTYIAKMSCTD